MRVLIALLVYLVPANAQPGYFTQAEWERHAACTLRLPKLDHSDPECDKRVELWKSGKLPPRIRTLPEDRIGELERRIRDLELRLDATR